MMKEKFEAVIIGAGLAGLQCARRLAEGGVSVLLADRKDDLAAGVHTTGIFVRKTFEDFSFPAGSLGKPVSRVRLYSPALRCLEMESRVPEFRIGRMGPLYLSLLKECSELGVVFKGGTRFAGSRPDPEVRGGSIVRFESAGAVFEARTKVLVGADGTGSAVARDLGLELNKQWIVGYEEVLRRPSGGGEPVLHCFFDAELAPGYLAWVADDGDECHIGVGGYPQRFDPKSALRKFRETVAPLVAETDGLQPLEKRGGRIPVGGVLGNISCERGLLVGDAAGAVSPLTAGGLDPCLRLSAYAAETVIARLSNEDPAIFRSYSGGMFRRKFLPRLLMRSALRAVRYQSQFEIMFKAMGTAPGRFIAEKIFFRRASFPDIAITHPARRAVAEAIESGRGRAV
jgi:flavin-dependent dehydrogenase